MCSLNDLELAHRLLPQLKVIDQDKAYVQLVFLGLDVIHTATEQLRLGQNDDLYLQIRTCAWNQRDDLNIRGVIYKRTSPVPLTSGKSASSTLTWMEYVLEAIDVLVQIAPLSSILNFSFSEKCEVTV